MLCAVMKCRCVIFNQKYFFQVEGKGNGIKTVIVNMVDIGKSLRRPPACKLVKYFNNYQMNVQGSLAK